MTSEIAEVKGVCPLDCPDTCGLVTRVENGRAVALGGDPGHAVTRGWLCAKVRPYLEHVYRPDRLTTPLRRRGPKGGGGWEPISWAEAISEIGERWREISASYGAAAILPYSYSGTLGLVQNLVAASRFWNRLGASQLERAICGPAAETAVEWTLGARLSPDYEDVVHSKLVIIWAHNPVTTAPHFMPFLRQAQRQGCQLVVIDPHRTRTAKGADWHLQIRPGTDGALALGLAGEILAQGWQDEAWLAAHTVGWPALRARLQNWDAERAAPLTGLAAADIRRLAELYAATRPGLIKIADGLVRNFNGGQTARAICALPALTGQYGARGGGLAYSTSGNVSWDWDAVSHQNEYPPAARTINMNRLGAALLGEADPPIQSLYVFAANPVASSPNASQIVAGLQREDLFTVVHELFLTDTADYADIVLPATSQLEQVDLHKAYGHRLLGYNRPAIPPLGHSQSNWDVMRLLAQEMGFDEPWLQQTADEVIDEVWAATAARNPALAKLSLAELRRQGSLLLPAEPQPPFANGQFPTPSGKLELYCEKMAAAGLDPLPDYQARQDEGGVEPAGPLTESLMLLSPAAHHFVSSSFGGQERLLQREGAAILKVNPADAAVRGIETGQAVRVRNGRGELRLQAVVTEDVPAGVVLSFKGYWPKLSGGRNVNWTTSDAIGDLAGQSTFQSNCVWVSR
ncbi:MAG: molybdopterin-dependent oxidoreductase [Anaerolineales bacterium]|nr:molybdopterin-dependent oxidoreductase [Anaerolineales bacterium]